MAMFASLNPYCSGQWSRTYKFTKLDYMCKYVLILIVVDNGLVQARLTCMGRKAPVLILIVVDNGLVLVLLSQLLLNVMKSLNPYCSGQWSRTMKISVKGGGNLES